MIKDIATAVPAAVASGLLHGVATSFKFDRLIEHPWIYFTGAPLNRVEFLL